MGTPSLTPILTPNEYQRRAVETAVYPNALKGYPQYALNGLAGEAGEIIGKTKKFFRDHGLPLDWPVGALSEEQKAKLKGELGDVAWYLAVACAECGFTLEEVMQANLDKLASRAERGVLKGDGDNR